MKKLLKIVGVFIITFGLLYGVYQLFLNPYRNVVTREAWIETMELDNMLTKKQAKEDLDFVMKRLKERHPAFIKTIPEAVNTQYEVEIDNLKDNVSVLDVWRSIARIFHKLGDGHTSVRYYTTDYNILPYTFDGELISAIDGISKEELYKTFSNQFSYELESYAEAVFNSIINTEEYLAFVGVNTSDGVDITYTRNGEELVEHYDFVPTSQLAKNEDGKTTDSDSEPFVSYEIDKENKLGILNLQQCIYDDYYVETLEKFFRDVKDNNVYQIVVDLRDNGGGNSMVINEFFRYLDIDEFKVFGGVDVRYGSILYKSNSGFDKNKKINNLLFTGKLYVLTSTNTFSSAMDFAVAVSDNKIGTIVGEIPGNMPSCYGDNLYFQTPNSKLSFSVSYKYFHRVDKSKDSEPLVPDYEVSADEALDKVYELIVPVWK
jgi:hypothetical protein